MLADCPTALGRPAAVAFRRDHLVAEDAFRRAFAGESVTEDFRFGADFVEKKLRVHLTPANDASAGGPWVQLVAAPADGGFEKVGVSAKIDESEGDRSGLQAPLQHRIGTMLGLMRSIARRTSETSASVEDYAMHMEGRLDALGRVQ